MPRSVPDANRSVITIRHGQAGHATGGGVKTHEFAERSKNKFAATPAPRWRALIKPTTGVELCRPGGGDEGNPPGGTTRLTLRLPSSKFGPMSKLVVEYRWEIYRIVARNIFVGNVVAPRRANTLSWPVAAKLTTQKIFSRFFARAIRKLTPGVHPGVASAKRTVVLPENSVRAGLAI